MAIIKICFPFKKQFFDKKASELGLLLCGVDEVGRGCLAGPVVAAALILKPQALRRGRMPQLADSKALTAHEREKAYTWLVNNSWFATAIVNHRVIDAINIYQATLKAMRKAVVQLRVAHPHLAVPSAVLVDAMPLDASFLWESGSSARINLKKGQPEAQALFDNPWNNTLYFYYGEEHSKSIAAASIIAKVTRDRIMQRMAPQFPRYQFESHKGYAVPTHKEVVTTLGRTLIHRTTYRSEYELPDEDNQQASLFGAEQVSTEQVPT